MRSTPSARPPFIATAPSAPATPDTIETLLEHDHPAGLILYYRGGLPDWVTLGLPLS